MGQKQQLNHGDNGVSWCLFPHHIRINIATITTSIDVDVVASAGIDSTTGNSYYSQAKNTQTIKRKCYQTYNQKQQKQKTKPRSMGKKREEKGRRKKGDTERERD
ncbi:unnamed protein product [Prunus armeniaca]